MVTVNFSVRENAKNIRGTKKRKQKNNRRCSIQTRRLAFPGRASRGTRRNILLCRRSNSRSMGPYCLPLRGKVSSGRLKSKESQKIATLFQSFGRERMDDPIGNHPKTRSFLLRPKNESKKSRAASFVQSRRRPRQRCRIVSSKSSRRRQRAIFNKIHL